MKLVLSSVGQKYQAKNTAPNGSYPVVKRAYLVVFDRLKCSIKSVFIP
jgi:hypothetical protein